MHVIRLLSAFYKTISTDQRVGATHISIYFAFLYEYSTNRYQNPVTVKRNIVMMRAKVRSRTTYDKCIHDLHNYGYIEYTPSYDYGGSKVNIIDLS